MALETDYRSELRCRLGNCARSIGRKRVVSSHCLQGPPFSSPSNTPPRKRPASRSSTQKLHLEALPQDILVQILCFVDHDDLKQLFHVSKSVREAATIAGKLHFAYSTPSKTKTARLTPSSGSDDSDEFEDAPNAPMRQRYRIPLTKRELAGITVALFT